MRLMIVFLAASFWAPSVLCQQSSQPSRAPLSEQELHRILDQLRELAAARVQITALEVAIARDREQDDRERANTARALELEKEATAVAQKERDLAIRERDLAADKASFYAAAFKSLTKKPGLGCRIFSAVFTLGMHRCN